MFHDFLIDLNNTDNGMHNKKTFNLALNIIIRETNNPVDYAEDSNNYWQYDLHGFQKLF